MSLALVCVKDEDANKSSEKYLENIAKMDFLHKQPEYFIYEYFQILKNKIDIRRDEIKLKIDKHFDAMLEQVCKHETECYENLSSKQTHEIGTQILKKELDNFKAKLEEFMMSISNLNWENLNKEIQHSNQAIKDKIEEFQETLLNNNCFDFISDFEEKDLEKVGKLMVYGRDEKKYDLISCSVDKTIKFWDLVNEKCYMTLEGHTDAVLSVEMLSKNRLVSCSIDSTIKIWDLVEGECIQTMEIPAGLTAWSLTKINEDEFAIGCSNGDIILWSCHQLSYVRKLLGHTESINALKLYDRNKLISGAQDNSIRIWNIEDGICIATLKGHPEYEGGAMNFEIFAGNKLMSCSNDKVIKVWNLDILECVYNIGIEKPVCGFELLGDNRMAILSDDISINLDSIEIMELDSFGYMSRFEANDKMLFNLKALSHNKLLTCSQDGVIELWNTDDFKSIKKFKAHDDEIWQMILLEKD